MIYVVPGAEHLYQMKAVLYEKPYKNPVQQVEYPASAPLMSVRCREPSPCPPPSWKPCLP